MLSDHDGLPGNLFSIGFQLSMLYPEGIEVMDDFER